MTPTTDNTTVTTANQRRLRLFQIVAADEGDAARDSSLVIGVVPSEEVQQRDLLVVDPFPEEYPGREGITDRTNRVYEKYLEENVKGKSCNC